MRYAAVDASTSEIVVALSNIDETRSTGKRYYKIKSMDIFY